METISVFSLKKTSEYSILRHTTHVGRKIPYYVNHLFHDIITNDNELIMIEREVYAERKIECSYDFTRREEIIKELSDIKEFVKELQNKKYLLTTELEIIESTLVRYLLPSDLPTDVKDTSNFV